MNKNRSNYINLYKLIFMIALTSCAIKPPRSDGGSLDLVKVLDQINDSIQAAREMNGPNAPQITSVQLDLQLGTSTDVTGSTPFSIVTPKGEYDQSRTHKVSLSFTPKAISTAALNNAKTSPLTEVISAIDRAVAAANPKYQFQNGSVQIQCTFNESLGANASLSLIPLQLGATQATQSVQTITLNIGPQQAAPLNEMTKPSTK
jgi:hypothetical protein